jgi:hypothetical protein
MSVTSESEVFEKTLENVERRGWDPFVHIPEAHADEYENIVESYPRHEITISGRYPDILGYTPTNQIFAVEVKGSKDLLKGLGQALVYQTGSDRSYVASAARPLEGVSEVALSKGLGTISVSTSGDTNWEDPKWHGEKQFRDDVERQLKYRVRGYETAGKITAMSLHHPVNFLAPIFPVREGAKTKDEIKSNIQENYDFDAIDGSIKGATTLRLIKEGDGVCELTDQGELALSALRGSGVRDLASLKKIKESSGGRGNSLQQEYPEVATLLRNLFFRHPEFESFVSALYSVDLKHEEGNKVYFPDLLRHLIENYPNVFLNMLCSGRTRGKARRMIENGKGETIYENNDVWRDLVRNNVLFNFTGHLKHMGILSAETKSHGEAMSEYEPSEKPWILSDNI